jgi:predicted acylesterase/phospholipase RssA
MATATARSGNEGPVFEFGLVLAGAISAGAYTAGVVDFLLEALDAWEAAKARETERGAVPRHGVKLKVITGSSAGGMTAAILAGMLGEPRPPEGTRSRLHRLWVDGIDIEDLLGTRDLDDRDGKPIRSLLDSTALDRVAADAFPSEAAGEPPERPFLANPVHLLLTLTNLRGVPYRFDLNGARATNYQMRLHADYRHFELARPGLEEDEPRRPARAGAGAARYEPRRLGWRHYQQFGWDLLREAALATGAFPFGLAPRVLRRKIEEYEARDPNPFAIRDVLRREIAQGKAPPLAPYWPDAMPDDYGFACVDGGVIDNEPLELARRVLLEDHDAGGPGRGRRGGVGPEHANHALVLVDPFPDRPTFPVGGDGITPPDRHADDLTTFGGLLHLGGAFVRGLIDQARFQPCELEAALSPWDATRFLVEPARYARGLPDRQEQYAIACGSVGGFGGFLDRAFRDHDYELGRSNARRFLRKHFVLDAGHELFGGGRGPSPFDVRRTADGARAWVPEDGPPPPDLDPDRRYLPIIPLVGGLERETRQPPAWPTLAPERLAAVRARLHERLRRLGDRLIDEQDFGFPWADTLRGLWHQKLLREAAGRMMGYVEEDLGKRGLLPPAV